MGQRIWTLLWFLICTVQWRLKRIPWITAATVNSNTPSSMFKHQDYSFCWLCIESVLNLTFRDFSQLLSSSFLRNQSILNPWTKRHLPRYFHPGWGWRVKGHALQRRASTQCVSLMNAKEDGEGGLGIPEQGSKPIQREGWHQSCSSKRTKEQTQQFKPHTFLWFSKTLTNLSEAIRYPYGHMPPELQGVSLSLLTFPSTTQCSYWAAAVQASPSLWVTCRKAASAGPSLRPEYTCHAAASQPPLGSLLKVVSPFLPKVDLPFHIPSYVTGFFSPLLALTTTCNFFIFELKKIF